MIDYDKLLRMRVLASGESIDAIRKQLRPEFGAPGPCPQPHDPHSGSTACGPSAPIP